MLPDFPAVKALARRRFVEAVQNRVAIDEPILGQITRRRIHEGERATLTRADTSRTDIEFQQTTAELAIPREQMFEMTVEQLRDHVAALSSQFAEQQSRMMFARVAEAVDAVGNVVSAGELGEREAFLEMLRRIQTDFDPETLEPKNQIIVVHANHIDAFRAKVQEWSKDQEFVAEMQRIKDDQLEKWRARENRRKLVD
jgi:hypothetical protein